MNQSHKKPATSIDLADYAFSIGMDTFEIAQRLGLKEADVYNELSKLRDEANKGASR